MTKINLLEACKAVRENMSMLTDKAIIDFKNLIDEELGKRQEREKNKQRNLI